MGHATQVIPFDRAEFFFDFFLVMGLNITIYGAAFAGLIRILHRMGLSGWWSLMIFLWPIGLLMLAFCRWPAFDKEPIKTEVASSTPSSPKTNV